MGDAALAALFGAIPGALTVLLIAGVAIWRRRDVGRLFDRVTGLSLGGFSVQLAGDALRYARPDHPLTSGQTARVTRRAEKLLGHLRTIRLLWVDDHPESNSRERKFLRSAGVEIRNVLTTDEAIEALERDDFDVVVTDMVRGTSTDAGIVLVEQVRVHGWDLQVICYLHQQRPDLPTPVGMRAVVARPDELMHQIFDVAERAVDHIGE